MNQQPSGTEIVHEIEIALARCTNPEVSKLSQSIRVIDFLDTQRHKIEQAQWTPQSFYADRVALSLSKTWREAPSEARQQVKACLANMGTRIQHAEQMKSIWGQIVDLREDLGTGVAGVVRETLDFASRLTRRRDDSVPEPVDKPRAAMR